MVEVLQVQLLKATENATQHYLLRIKEQNLAQFKRNLLLHLLPKVF